MNNFDYDNLLHELNKHNYINTSELHNLGLNTYKINKLVLDNKLIRVAKGYYKINISSKDYNYKSSILKHTRKELEQGNYELASNMIKEYNHFKTSKNAHYLLYQIYLLQEKYEEAKIELLKSIMLSNDEDQNKSYALYMLNKIIEKEEEIKSLKKRI